MRALVVYESMFGSTHLIAEAIAEGLRTEADVQVSRVGDAPKMVDDVELLVVGGPTHAWGMSRPSTRKGAPLHIQRPDSTLALEPGADVGSGVREWLVTAELARIKAAAFDTRIEGPVVLTGRASKGIGRRLSRRGLTLVASPESFLVDKKSHLLPGELERARAWGARVANVVGHAHQR